MILLKIKIRKNCVALEDQFVWVEQKKFSLKMKISYNRNSNVITKFELFFLNKQLHLFNSLQTIFLKS